MPHCNDIGGEKHVQSEHTGAQTVYNGLNAASQTVSLPWGTHPPYPHPPPSSSHTPSRGIWLELVSLLYNWAVYGREWWHLFLLAWPPALVGFLLLASRPTVAMWYGGACIGACCIIDAMPLWMAAAFLKVRGVRECGGVNSSGMG